MQLGADVTDNVALQLDTGPGLPAPTRMQVWYEPEKMGDLDDVLERLGGRDRFVDEGNAFRRVVKLTKDGEPVGRCEIIVWREGVFGEADRAAQKRVTDEWQRGVGNGTVVPADGRLVRMPSPFAKQEIVLRSPEGCIFSPGDIGNGDVLRNAGCECAPPDGRPLRRQEYPELYDVIGTRYNLDGSYAEGVFAIPDMRGQVIS